MNIVLNLSEHWESIAADKSVQLLGCIHDLDQHQNTLAAVENIEAWAEKLKGLSGFFSLVKHEGNTLCAAVDHIRSRPLFYAVNEQGFYLSDSAEWVRQQVNDTVMDEFAKAEFQLTGYVTGRDTLYKHVKQLQAGECLVYADHTLAVERYYSFEHSEPEDYSEAALLAELDVVAKASIQRLIRYANGRQIVIPLSGGYDSRLIAALLKEANYDNILTFTYGVKGNKEAAYSKIVADNLGLEWLFVEYTEALWQAAWHTEERKRYQREGSNWTSLAHMQDWLAVKIMKEQGVAESNAVFAPGHCCVTGLIPSEIISKQSWNVTDTAENILNTHFNLCPISELNDGLYNEVMVQRKITDYLSGTSNLESHVSKMMAFNWEERQSKYIGNSVRVYDFFGYDWWMPLWDKEFTNYWKKIPINKRINRSLYVSYVNKVYLKNSKDRAHIGNAASSGLVGVVSNSTLLSKLRLTGFLRYIYKLYVKKIFKSSDKLLINSAQNQSEVKKLEEKGFLMNGITIYFFLNDHAD